MIEYDRLPRQAPDKYEEALKPRAAAVITQSSSRSQVRMCSKQNYVPISSSSQSFQTKHFLKVAL
jgi:hypothetical protein